MPEILREFWAVIIAAVAGLVWLVRLESRGLSTAAEVHRLWEQRKEDLQAAKDSRARNEKRLDEISTDIKAILRGLDK